MSNIQTGAERMPHDLSHLGFLAGQIGRLITISTTPVIAGDSFFFSGRRRHTRCSRDWSSDVCSSDLLFFSGFGVGGGFFLARVGVVAARGGGEADFLFRSVNFDALKLEEIQKAGLLCGAGIVSGKNPGGGAFGAGFPDRALALEIEVVQELLAVGGHVVHAKKNGALLHVDIVSR